MNEKQKKHKKFAYYIPMMFTYILALFFVNLFVFNEMAKYFPIPKDIYFYGALIALVIVPPVFIIIEKAKPRFFTRILYTIAMTTGGINFIIFTIVLVNWIINSLASLIGYIIPIGLNQLCLIILPSIISVYAIINATRLHNKKITVRIKGLKKKRKFVHLSDVHLGTVRKEEFLGRIVRRTNNLNPDAVFITGDLIDNNTKINDDILQELDNFRAPTYFVHGNHEEYEGYRNVNSKLEKTELIILKDKLVMQDEIQIIGVEHNLRHVAHLIQVLDEVKANPKKPTILLQHVPLGAEYAASKGVDLMLSGHTHSGQIIPFNFIVKLVFKYIHGLYIIGDMRLYTSAGTGTWGPVIRLGSNNEIVLIECVPKE